jgi:N-glycosylase/DNA lyase
MDNFSVRKTDPKEEIKSIYESKRQEIALRLHEFGTIWKKGTTKEIFAELAFCILTPQANGKACWLTVENMIAKGVLFEGARSQIVKELNCARFIQKKATYIVEAREKFLCDNRATLKSVIDKIGNGHEAREWLVNNVKGVGYKEASHFLRNIGFEQNLAILDRHIIKNLQLFGVIKEIPDSLPKGRYFDIEKKMMEFSKAIQIPMSYLDMVIWHKEKGEIFK